MQRIQHLISRWSAIYRKQDVTIVVLSSFALLFFACMCCCLSIAVFSPSTPTPEIVSTPIDTSNSQTSALETAWAIVTQTMQHAPTATFTPEPNFTATYIELPTLAPTPSATLQPFEFSCIPNTTKWEEGVVVDVVDGDTIDVDINGQTFRVRYIGIDTPERDEAFYEQATQLNRELVYTKKVLLVMDVSETDKYGRLLRYVFVGNTFVNYELVKRGYALAYTYPPDVACSDFFVNAQKQAQSSNVGLWASTPTPQPTVANNPGGNSGNCHPAYPTVCIPPPPPDLDCPDIPYRRFKVLPPDPHKFDRNHDGVGCEN